MPTVDVMKSLVRQVVDLLVAHPVLVLPFVILGALGGGNDSDREWRTAPDFSAENLPFYAAIGAAALVFLVIVLVLYGLAWAMTAGGAEEALSGGAPTLRSAYRAARPVLLPAVGTMLLGCLAIVLGFVALIVPGLILLAGLVPWAAVVVAERRKGRDALTRAWDVTRGRRGPVLLLVLGGIVASAIAGWILGWIPFVGDAIAGALGGLVLAGSATLGAILRRSAVEPAAPPAAPTAAAAAP